MIEESLELFKNKLVKKGIGHQDQLEELIDHYQTSLEYKLAGGLTYNDALTATISELEKANHKASTKSPNWVLIGIITIGLSLIAYANVKLDNTNNIISTPSQEKSPQHWPVDDTAKNISSKFGPRKHPIYKQFRNHRGIDIKANAGTAVVASSSGIVMEAGYHTRYGNYIIIEHSNRYSTRYMHLQKLHVSSCDQVVTNMEIGTVGSTGLSVAPHLHFEVLVDGVAVDPMDYLHP